MEQEVAATLGLLAGRLHISGERTNPGSSGPSFSVNCLWSRNVGMWRYPFPGEGEVAASGPSGSKKEGPRARRTFGRWGPLTPRLVCYSGRGPNDLDHCWLGGRGRGGNGRRLCRGSRLRGLEPHGPTGPVAPEPPGREGCCLRLWPPVWVNQGQALGF